MNTTLHTQASSISMFRRQVLLTSMPFLVVLGLITFVVNGLVAWIIIKDPLRTFRRSRILLDLGLFFDQFAAGMVLVPLIVAEDILNGLYSKSYDVLSTLVVVETRWCIGLGNAFMILNIFDGTGGITNPHFVRRVTTKRNVVTAILIALATTFIYSLLLILGVSEQVHAVIFVHVFVLLPIVVAGVVFIRTYKKIRNPKMVAPTTSISVYNKEKLKISRLRNEKISKNFIKIILICFSLFGLSMSSYYIFIMTRTFITINNRTCEEARWCIVHQRLMLSLIFAHFAFTPIFLTLKITEYRNAVFYALRKLASKLCRR